MINLKNISVTRGNKKVFLDYNLGLYSPGLNIISGKNGSGKTTLIKVISGLIKPSKGIIINKTHPTTYEWSQKHIYIGSNHSSSNELSIIENIKMWAKIRGWNFSENEIEDYMREIGIIDFKNFLISQCSEGIKRKTDLCKLFFSFKNKIKFWLLDEPVNNLDDDGRKKFQILMQNFLNKNGTIIMTSHDKNIFKLKYKKIELI